MSAVTERPLSVNRIVRGSPRNREADDLVVLLGIIDDEGKEQRIRVRCKGHEKPRTRAEPAFESIAAIEDTIEQEVAAALQAEVARYDKNGRRGGGLGSMFVKYRDRELTAFGGDAWTEGSSANQEVVADPDAATFHSDNLEVLLSRYTQLPTDDERNRFAHALLKRLQEDKGYARVAYLIVCCLWKIGQLQDALEAMKFGLRENDRVNHGISNALMMFNGLLRFRHPDFTTEALDNLEGFLQGSEEHPFQIRQKIAAIRASRLRAS